MQRFTGVGDAPGRLDAILFETFDDELRAAREAEDRRIVDFVDGLCFFSGCRQNRPPDLNRENLTPQMQACAGGLCLCRSELSKTTDSAATDPLIY